MKLIHRLQHPAYPEKPNQASKLIRKRQSGPADKAVPLLSFVDGENQQKEIFF